MQLTMVNDADVKAARKIKYSPLLRKIVFEVSAMTGIEAGEILGPKKTASLVLARDLVCFMARREGMTLERIADGINRHHTSVMEAIKREAARRACESADDVPE